MGVICFGVFFLTLVQLEEGEAAGVVIRNHSLLSLFKQAATTVQLWKY